ncbi:uncharacterized protein Dwil_GK27128 [Drosophila willistoni]|nr:uncharacterized protein Dwil_GK27128 [Drosophila willistoni]
MCVCVYPVCVVLFVLYVVLDVICFERLLGNCIGLLQRGISDYRYLEQDLRTYFDGLQIF